MYWFVARWVGPYIDHKRRQRDRRDTTYVRPTTDQVADKVASPGYRLVHGFVSSPRFRIFLSPCRSQQRDNSPQSSVVVPCKRCEWNTHNAHATCGSVLRLATAIPENGIHDSATANKYISGTEERCNIRFSRIHLTDRDVSTVRAWWDISCRSAIMRRSRSSGESRGVQTDRRHLLCHRHWSRLFEWDGERQSDNDATLTDR